MTELVPPMIRPEPTDSTHHHILYRNMLAAIEDFAAAWHQVVDIDNVDVGDPSERHIAAARLGRMFAARYRKLYGHPIPVSVVPCAVAVLHNQLDCRWDVGDHVLLVTDRAVADLGLAARCPSMPIPEFVIERPLDWIDRAEFLMYRTAEVTITYVAHDRHTHQRAELWQRTNAAWADAAGRLQAEYDRLLNERVRREWEGGRPRGMNELASL